MFLGNKVLNSASSLLFLPAAAAAAAATAGRNPDVTFAAYLKASEASWTEALDNYLIAVHTYAILEGRYAA
ncbi:hypothetical protein F4809DRAFT_644446 [Biscogniauxia mediterranea]|nr:hypothetical protein F4809DRAFT_644446 [Biscogniauxia mediterranea]